MPRRNSNAKDKEPTQAFHGATQYNENYRYNKQCVGCAFVGEDFMCMTSNGECLKTPAYKGKSGRGERFQSYKKTS